MPRGARVIRDGVRENLRLFVTNLSGLGNPPSKIPKIRPRDLAVPGPNLGVGVRHSLFPDCTRLGALAFAGCVLPDATLRGMRMFRSHGGTVLAVAGRDLLSEASSPSSVAPCRERRAGRGADTSAILLRVGTLTTGTAPACGWPLALRYGSGLLTLRLRSLLQCGGVLFHAAPLRRLTGFAGPAHSPPPCLPCAPCSRGRTGPFGGGCPAGKRDCVLVCAVAAVTLWVTALMVGSKLTEHLTRLGRGF